MNRMIPFPVPNASALLPYICLCIATSIADADAIVDNDGKNFHQILSMDQVIYQTMHQKST